jgi:hypothetical protein
VVDRYDVEEYDGCPDEDCEVDDVIETLEDNDSVPEIVKYEPVWRLELVVETVTVRVWLNVLTNVDVDVSDGLLDEVLVLTELLEMIEDADEHGDPELVFDWVIDGLTVALDLKVFDIIPVLVGVLETVEVLDFEADPENEDEALEVFEFLDDNVWLGEIDEVFEFLDDNELVEEIDEVFEDVIVSVFLDDEVEVLLFLIDTVDVFVLIIDEVEHGLPLGVFVCLDVTVWLTDELDVLLGWRVNVGDWLLLIVLVTIEDNVGVLVAIDVLDKLGEAVWVFDFRGLAVPEDDPEDVFDTVIEDVLVRLATIVRVNIEYLENEAEHVDVLEVAPVLLDVGDDEGVFELLWEFVEQAELVDVFEEDVVPLDVFDRVVVLVRIGEDVIVDEALAVRVLNGEDEEVLDIVDDLVEVCVLADVKEGTLETV